METLGWLVEAVLTVDVWRSASSTCGELSVMIPGQVLMPEWFADSWDIQELVSNSPYYIIMSNEVEKHRLYQFVSRGFLHTGIQVLVSFNFISLYAIVCGRVIWMRNVMWYVLAGFLICQYIEELLAYFSS